MTQTKEIARRLSEVAASEPPEELESRLLATIPEELPRWEPPASSPRTASRAWMQLAAASVLLLVAAALLLRTGVDQVGSNHQPESLTPPTSQPRPTFSPSPTPTPELAPDIRDDLRDLGYLDSGATFSEPRYLRAPEGIPGELPPAYVPPDDPFAFYSARSRPPDAMYFRGYGVNPSVDTARDPQSTFGLDVDTASFTLVRKYLEDGNLPPRQAIRVEELVNYFDYGDPAPRKEDFAIRVEGAPTPFTPGPDYRLLRINIKARELDPEDRKPAVLIFVVDTSGSMGREDRLGLAKQALSILIRGLRRDDRVGLVEYGSRARVVLEPTSDLSRLEWAIDSLRPGGSTNAEAGLSAAYDMADRYFISFGINRLILCSDGVANVGLTDAQSILRRIGEQARRGIRLTTVGFGMGNYNDELLEQLADRGDGSYAYVDDIPEARRIFQEQLTGTLQLVAEDARVQVEFEPSSITEYRLIGYENRDIPDVQFRNDYVDAGEIGSGHSVTALYEVRLASRFRGHAPVATVRLRYRAPSGGPAKEIARGITLRDFSPSWRRSSPALRLAALTAETGEILKESAEAYGSDLGTVARHCDRLSREGTFRTEARELRWLALRGQALR